MAMNTQNLYGNDSFLVQILFLPGSEKKQDEIGFDQA